VADLNPVLAMADHLVRHHQRAGFYADSAGGSMAEVHSPDAHAPDKEKREVEIHRQIWRAAYPEAVTEIVP
jgi:hypothetical protein